MEFEQNPQLPRQKSHVTKFESGDITPDPKSMNEFFGPQAVDNSLRQTITLCWMLLPEGQKNVEAVEAEIRRLVDRALANLKEDAAAFGIKDEDKK